MECKQQHPCWFLHDRSGGVSRSNVSPQGRSKGGQGGYAVGSTRPKATGIAEALVNVLNARRSPLTFRIEPLVLHLTALDDHDNDWRGGQESGMFLVAKREVVTAVAERPTVRDNERRATETGDKTAEPVKPAVAPAGAGSKGGDKSSHNAEAVSVVEEEELGRIGPFTIHSPTTVLSGSSFTVPSNALVADVQRRGGSGTGRNSAASGEESVESIVLEIVKNTAGVGGNKLTLLKKIKKRARDSASEEGPGGCGGTVVARATLDPGLLRRTIGCQRSVLMMAPPAGVGEADVSDQDAENAGRTVPLSFARLDVAGHAVGARPGRPQLTLQVLECQNLMSADVLGKSDPCVLVFWDGVEVGRTPIVRDELHPVFPASGGTFCLPLVPPSTTRAEEGDRWSGPKRSADWEAYSPELHLEVWDMDRDVFSRKWKKGQMLGSVTLQGPRGIAPVIEASSADQGAKRSTAAHVKRQAPGVILRLNPADRRVFSFGSAVGEPDHASTGVVSILIAVENDSDDSEAWVSQAHTEATAARGSISSATIVPALDSSASGTTPIRSPGTEAREKVELQGGLGIWCLDARGLPAGCDGYCRVFWNGMQVGSTPPASHAFQGLRGRSSASEHNATPASAFQRNPVWWMSQVQAQSPRVEHGEATPDPKVSSATAVVPLYDNPKVEDELTLEVFDGSHMQEANQSIASSRGPAVGKDGADGRRKNGAGGKGSENSATVRRDVLGRSLGSVTIRGEYLSRPPGDRVDLPLQPSNPSSSKDSNAAGITLSITLARLRLGELFSPGLMWSSAHPRQNIVPEQEQHKSDSTVVATGWPTATAAASSGGDEGQAGVDAGKEHHQQRPTRWLRLLLEGARLCKGSDISGTSDPFCVVYVDRVWYSETRVCWGTLAPRWDQWVQIKVFGRAGAPAMVLGLGGHEIRVEMWDKDLVGANDFIGEVLLFLHEKQDG